MLWGLLCYGERAFCTYGTHDGLCCAVLCCAVLYCTEC